MKVLGHFKDIDARSQAVVLAVGYFDGVHLGHQSVIQNARQCAAARGGQTWILTFDPHPLKILRPEMAPPLLTSTAHKLDLFRAMGVEGCVVLPFTRELSAQEPEDFIKSLKASVPDLQEMVVGNNWTFGHRARGNPALLQKMAADLGFRATVVPPVVYKKAPISSTRVRQEITEGHLADVADMLGRPFSILGTVIPGKQFGRVLGFPTANIDPHNEVHPPPGIYAVFAVVAGQRVGGAAFLGASPETQKTPSGAVIEVHLFDITADLYGKDLEVQFIEKIREERRFASPADLSRQIGLDVEEARQILKNRPVQAFEHSSNAD